MVRKLFVCLLAVFWVLPAASQITVRPGVKQDPRMMPIYFSNGHAVNTITDPIPAAFGMWFVWDRGSDGAISCYWVESDDDTVSEVEGGALIHAFTTDTTYKPTGTPAKPWVRCVVDTAETGSTPGKLEVYLSNELASGGGSSAPGVSGNMATLETLQWIWGLERVPFPDRIDKGQWTDYYFSNESSGSWPTGDDSNDGLTPETAKRTLDAAKTTCFGGAYRRCNFDTDDWTIGNGGLTNGFGEIADADITLGDCPTSVAEVLEQPCFWLRSLGPGRALFDATGTSSASMILAFQPIADRSHLLIEAIDIIGDSTTGNLGTAIDTFETGVITVVAGDLTNTSDGTTGTNQIASAHDVSVTHVYGRSDMAYTGDNSGASSGPLAFGANASGSVAYHSSGTLTTCQDNSCIIGGLDNSTGTADSSLDAEMAATCSSMFFSGVDLIGSVDTGRGFNFRTSNVNATRSNCIKAYLVSTRVDADENTFYVTDVDPGGYLGLNLINVTATSGAANPRHFIHVAAMDPTGVADLRLSGVLYETFLDPADLPNDHNILKIQSNDWLPSSSTVELVDLLYESVSRPFRMLSASGNCFTESTASAWAACVNALRADAVRVVNPIEITSDDTGTATGGSGTTLVDSGAGWTTDEWIDAIVRITSGTGVNQTRRVISNTGTTLTVAAWDTNPVSGSGYSIEHFIDPDNGFCDVVNDAECEGAAAGSSSDYSIQSLPLRVQIPSFIAGRRITGFLGEPSVYSNIGRQRPEPWSAP